MAFSSGLPPHVIKCIRARLVLLTRMERERIEGSEGAYRQLETILDEITDGVLENPYDESPVERFIEKLRDAIRPADLALPPGVARDRTEALVRELDQRLVNELNRLNHDPLAVLFSAVWDATRSVYERSGVNVTNGPPISYSAVHYEGVPHRLPCRYRVAGLTRFELDNAGAQTSNVVITIQPRRLDWPTALAVPYVIFHECVAHVLQGPWLGTRESSVGSSFSEGWMDLVALTAHEAFMDGWLGSSSRVTLTDPEQLPQHHKIAAGRYSEARRTRSEQDRLWASRELGFRVAEQLLEVLRELPETGRAPRGALEALWRLSVLINVSDLPSGQRELLVADLNAIIQRGGATITLRPLLLSFLKAADVGGFARATHDMRTAG